MLTGFSQEVKIQWYSVNEGLSQSLVHCFYEDSKGFMWIGTGDGLNRFDGNTFTVFKNDNTDSGSIINNTVRSIISDRGSRLLVGTEGGVSVFNEVAGKFDNEVPVKSGLAHVWGLPIYFSRDSILLYCGLHGIYSYNLKSKKTVCCFSSLTNVEKVREDKDGFWMCVYPDTLLFVSKGDFKITGHYISPGRALNFIDEYDANNLLIPTAKGVYTFNKSTHLYTLVPQTSGAIAEDVMKDSHGNIWVGAENDGLYEYTHSWQQKLYVSDYDIKAMGIASTFKHIRNLYEDQSGNIWIGTDGAGICKISLHEKKIAHIYAPVVPLSSNFTRCFYQGNDSMLYAGTYNEGLDAYDRKTGKVTVVNSLRGNTINSITPLNNNRLWVCTESGLNLYDSKSGVSTYVKVEQNKPYMALQVIKRGNGDWLLLALERVYRILEDNGQFTLQLISPPEQTWHISAFYETEDGDLYLAHIGGIFSVIHGREYGSLKPITGTTEGPYRYHCFCKDASGNLWGASESGLVLLDKGMKPVKCFKTNDGLPDNMVYGMLADTKGNLWLSSNKGLSRFNTSTHLFRNYTLDDGLQSYEYNTGAYFKTASGEMMFGGVNGFNIFYPDSVKDNPSISKTVITAFKLFDKPYGLDSSSIFKSLVKLNYTQNIITFEFAGLEYTDPVKNVYAYMLEGIDTGWVFAGNVHFARYADLMPGNYTFKVKSANNDGVWGSTASMNIVITPPYWQTLPFRILFVVTCLLMVAGIIVAIVRRRYRKILEYHERQREIEKVRARISKDIHDDLGAGLSKIKILTELMSDKAIGNKYVETGIKSISDTSSSLVENMRDLVWMLNPGNTTLDNLVARIREYSSDYLGEFPVEYISNIPEAIPEMQITPEAYRHIFSIVKECLQNSIKHSHANEIRSDIEITETDMVIAISDNGKGFEPSGREGGNGLRNMQFRAEATGGKLELWSAPGKGTIIKILIAIQSMRKGTLPLS